MILMLQRKPPSQQPERERGGGEVSILWRLNLSYETNYTYGRIHNIDFETKIESVLGLLKLYGHDPHACGGMMMDMVYKYEVFN